MDLSSAVGCVTTMGAVLGARNGAGGRSHRTSKHSGKQYPKKELSKFCHVFTLCL